MIVKKKVPSPTPPHKGEGLTSRLPLHSILNAEYAASSSPSPLWGGVGEGFLP